MSEKRKIEMSTDGKNIKNIKPEVGSKMVAFLCRGGGMSFQIPGTGGNFKVLNSDGSETNHIVRPKEAVFNNGWFETDDPEILEKIKDHPRFGHDFYYHPNFCPEDADIERAKRFLPGSPGMRNPAEEERRIDNAKTFDQHAHPVDGVENPIDPDTGKPDPGGAWPS